MTSKYKLHNHHNSVKKQFSLQYCFSFCKCVSLTKLRVVGTNNFNYRTKNKCHPEKTSEFVKISECFSKKIFLYSY